MVQLPETEPQRRSRRIRCFGQRLHDQTKPSPSEVEIAATYEEGKDRDFSDQSPEPAFHRRYSASFAYLVGDYKNFLDEEIAKLSEETLRAEYERRLKGGDFQLPDSTPTDAPEGDAGAGDDATPAEQTEEVLAS